MNDGALKYFNENNVATKLLEFAMKAGISMSVTGTTGVGKTTLLEELVNFVPAWRRIVVLQSYREIRLKEKYPHRDITESNEVEEDIESVLSSTSGRGVPLVIIGAVPQSELLKYLSHMAGTPVLLFEYPTASENSMLEAIPKAMVSSGLSGSVSEAEDILGSAVRLSVHVTRSSDGDCFISHINEILQKKDINIKSIFGRNVVAYVNMENRHVATSSLSSYLNDTILGVLGYEDSNEFREFVAREWGS
jgi:Flp pilus assembly CpaF family ATPase